MSIDLSKFHDTFFEECAEHRNTMETGLLALDKGAEDPELLHAIFRAAHSIKGGAGSFGFPEIADFTHVLENLLDRLRDGRLAFSANLGSLLLEATDTLGHLVDATKSGDPTKVRRADVTGRLERVQDGGNVAPRGTGHAPMSAVPKPTGERTITVTIDPKREASESGSIRVSTEKIDSLSNLVGELVIAQSMVNQAARKIPPDEYSDLQEALGIAARNTRELQEHVMAIRMLPVGTLFNRFPRLVRDLSDKLGKDVRLEISGAETELDKSVLERLGDPLTHLIRNAVDHGIERPGDRAATGKLGGGTITLSAGREGRGVVIEIADDGRGLPVAKIRAKAVAQGRIAEGAVLTDEELNRLILAPGFSTADGVSDVSGRGVGMDVVKRNVEGLSGALSIVSVPNKGTRIRIRLPLTLAILDGLSVSVAEQVYVIPLLSIVQSLRPAPADIRVVFGRGEMLLLREETLPLIRLHEVFCLEGGIREPCHGIVVVIESDGKRFGLLVDDVIGQLQVVIKNLERHFRRVMGCMGATILADGRVGFIIDVDELLRLRERRALPDLAGRLVGPDATMEEA